jgi:6-pyruvoyltetrahydropterin/6-carboxytetrahydropterin synthase
MLCLVRSRGNESLLYRRGESGTIPGKTLFCWAIRLYNKTSDFLPEEYHVYEIMVQDSFSAAHRLKEYGGKCEELHGHNWHVDVVVRAARLDDTGLALDFRTLKEHTRRALSALDHTFLNDLKPFREANPSSENIAKYLFQEIAAALADTPARVVRVNVWESDHACASYLGEGR